MKVSPEHRAMIGEAIAATGYDNPTVRARYVARDIPRGAAVQDIDKRFRWDLFHAADPQCAILRALYDAGCHDAHIDTALRSVVQPLESATASTGTA